jgi:hypothetical protein
MAWDVKTGEERWRLERLRDYIQLIVFLGDERRVLTGGSAGTASIREAQTGAAQTVLYGLPDYPRSARLSADGQQITTVSGGGIVQNWDAATGKELGQPAVEREPLRWGFAGSSPDGRRRVMGGGLGEPMKIGRCLPPSLAETVVFEVACWLPFVLWTLLIGSIWRDRRAYSKVRPNRAAVAAVVFLAGLPWLNVGAYYLFADDLMPATMTRFLPQDTHFSPGSRFDFACVSDETWGALTPAQRKALDGALARRFSAVCHGFAQIPEENKVYSAGTTRLDGLQYGCLLRWRLAERGRFWFTATYGDYEGSLAASWRDATFIWILGLWVKVRTGPMTVS